MSGEQEERPPCCLICGHYQEENSTCSLLCRVVGKLEGPCPPEDCPLPAGEEWESVAKITN